MGGRRASRVHRHGVRAAVAVATLAVLVAAAVGARVAWQDGRLNALVCGGSCGPENVVAPHGLQVGAPGPSEVSGQITASPLDPEAVVAAVRRDLGDSLLGDHVGFAAAAPQDEAPVAVAGTGVFTPASTTKLLTAFAALSTLDPESRFTTSVVDAGDGIVLVGGGDPYLTVRRDRGALPVERATLADLAERTATRLRAAGRTSVTLGYDTDLFTGPADNPAWEPGYVRDDIVTPISALWVDRGIAGGTRTSAPARAAADRFATLLRGEGIEVTGDVEPAQAPDQTPPLAVVRSATVAQVVENLVRASDNEAAEVVLRHVALAADRPASFEGGVEAVRSALETAGIDTEGLRLLDGSGLSRRNLISPTTLVEVVRASLASPRTAAAIDDLPVSGFSGTLADRFDGAARGLVRAKTGTLSGIHSLAGLALDADGRPVVFAVMSDRADRDRPFDAQAAVDDVAASIASCSCG